MGMVGNAGNLSLLDWLGFGLVLVVEDLLFHGGGVTGSLVFKK